MKKRCIPGFSGAEVGRWVFAPTPPTQSGENMETTARPLAQSTIQIDNERVTVTDWRFAPGTQTGWHVHPVGYVVVPMATGELVLETPGTRVTNHLAAGVSYTREAGGEHNVINAGKTEFVFVEIELKSWRSCGRAVEQSKPVV